MTAYNEHTTISFCQELLNSAAVTYDAAIQSGEDTSNTYVSGVMETCAMILAHNFERPYNEILEAAKDRARMFFVEKKDWQNELALYRTLLRFGKDQNVRA